MAAGIRDEIQSDLTPMAPTHAIWSSQLAQALPRSQGAVPLMVAYLFFIACW